MGSEALPPLSGDGAAIEANGTPPVARTDRQALVQRAIQDAARPLPVEMSLAQAADFLDVSAQALCGLLRRSELPCRKVGTRRLIPSAALVQYRDQMFQRATEAANEMTRLAEEYDMHRDDGPPWNTR